MAKRRRGTTASDPAFCISLHSSCSEKHIRVCQVLSMHGDICIYVYGDKWGSIGTGYVYFCDMSYVSNAIVVMQVLDMCT